MAPGWVRTELGGPDARLSIDEWPRPSSSGTGWSSRVRGACISARPSAWAGACPGIDTPAGWDGAVRLAEKLSLPVLVAPSLSRCPFPTRHTSATDHRGRSSSHKEPAPEAACAHQARPVTEREPPVRTSVDARALIAREQTVTEAVSPAMLAVTNPRHLTPAKNVGRLAAHAFLARVQRARGDPASCHRSGAASPAAGVSALHGSRQGFQDPLAAARPRSYMHPRARGLCTAKASWKSCGPSP